MTDAIDWAGGTRDPHAAWGISVAYLPFPSLDDALVLRHSSVVPTVRWVPEATGPAGALVDVQGQPVAGLAVTWPAGLQPAGLELQYLPQATTAVPVTVPLARVVPVLLGQVTAAAFARSPSSGAFVLPPGNRATAVIDWLSDGWPPGRYRFEVRADGVLHVVTFRLQSGV